MLWISMNPEINFKKLHTNMLRTECMQDKRYVHKMGVYDNADVHLTTT